MGTMDIMNLEISRINFPAELKEAFSAWNAMIDSKLSRYKPMLNRILKKKSKGKKWSQRRFEILSFRVNRLQERKIRNLSQISKMKFFHYLELPFSKATHIQFLEFLNQNNLFWFFDKNFDDDFKSINAPIYPEPCLKLWRKVLSYAILDSVYRHDDGVWWRYEDAVLWIQSDDTSFGSFLYVCDLLDYNPEIIRSKTSQYTLEFCQKNQSLHSVSQFETEDESQSTDEEEANEFDRERMDDDGEERASI